MTDYAFHNMGRIGMDKTDNSQRNVQNTKFANYTMANYFSQNPATDTIIFATQQPTMVMNSTTWGHGLSGQLVDDESVLTLGGEQERALEKLQLFPRSFSTVPYLGKGSCNPDVESKLLQGDLVLEKKSVSTIMDKSFMPYVLTPGVQESQPHPATNVEETSWGGWIRGGVPTRELGAS